MIVVSSLPPNPRLHISYWNRQESREKFFAVERQLKNAVLKYWGRNLIRRRTALLKRKGERPMISYRPLIKLHKFEVEYKYHSITAEEHLWLGRFFGSFPGFDYCPSLHAEHFSILPQHLGLHPSFRCPSFRKLVAIHSCLSGKDVSERNFERSVRPFVRFFLGINGHKFLLTYLNRYGGSDLRCPPPPWAKLKI